MGPTKAEVIACYEAAGVKLSWQRTRDEQGLHCVRLELGTGSYSDHGPFEAERARTTYEAMRAALSAVALQKAMKRGRPTLASYRRQG